MAHHGISRPRSSSDPTTTPGRAASILPFPHSTVDVNSLAVCFGETLDAIKTRHPLHSSFQHGHGPAVLFTYNLVPSSQGQHVAYQPLCILKPDPPPLPAHASNPRAHANGPPSVRTGIQDARHGSDTSLFGTLGASSSSHSMSRNPAASGTDPDRESRGGPPKSPKDLSPVLGGGRTSISTWPESNIPVEIWELIAESLNIDDVKNMRLVCHEFERSISHLLLKTAVVPFNPEIYGMIDTGRRSMTSPQRSAVGAGTAVGDNQNTTPGLAWKNATNNRLYDGHGMDVFKKFGHLIRRYGMSFEVTEAALCNPPRKRVREDHLSFWGAYEWPSGEYCRFADREGLEMAADETPTMKSAFSYLTSAQELALSVDSGLGWLSGPDKSIRTQVLDRPPPVFVASRTLPTNKTKSQKYFWNQLKAAYKAAGHLKPELRYATLWKQNCGADSLARISPILLREWKINTDQQLLSSAFAEQATPNETGKAGLLLSMPATSDGDAVGCSFYPIRPNSLTKQQEEWLLETEWAQRAFLTSYTISITDNAANFQHVHTLSLARLSSRYLHLISDSDFWDALPKLSTVKIGVVQDWRDVRKQECGYVDTFPVEAATAVNDFHLLLRERIAPKETVKSLEVGWTSGGERAQGIYARNHHLLPAPIVQTCELVKEGSGYRTGVPFHHVENLVLSNCWITPPLLVAFVQAHTKRSLKHLTLSSVSLTADPSAQDDDDDDDEPQQGDLAPHLNHVQTEQMLQQQLNFQQNGNDPPITINTSFGVELQTDQVVLPQYPHVNHILSNLATLLQSDFSSFMDGHLPFGSSDYYRQGCWPHILYLIGPSCKLPLWEDQGHPCRTSASRFHAARRACHDKSRSELLKSLTLKSCGYSKLTNYPHSAFDQSTLPYKARNKPRYFWTRTEALRGVMMSSDDILHGEIVQYIPWVEVSCLVNAWGFVADLPTGSDLMKGAWYDGYAYGGTGRLTGKVVESE